MFRLWSLRAFLPIRDWFNYTAFRLVLRCWVQVGSKQCAHDSAWQDNLRYRAHALRSPLPASLVFRIAARLLCVAGPQRPATSLTSISRMNQADESAAKLLSKDKARRIVANFGRLPWPQSNGSSASRISLQKRRCSASAADHREKSRDHRAACRWYFASDGAKRGESWPTGAQAASVGIFFRYSPGAIRGFLYFSTLRIWFCKPHACVSVPAPPNCRQPGRTGFHEIKHDGFRIMAQHDETGVS
jgi:hypothetical protein